MRSTLRALTAIPVSKFQSSNIGIQDIKVRSNHTSSVTSCQQPHPGRWLAQNNHAATLTTDLHFRIWHRFRVPGTDCAAGEEVAACFLLLSALVFYLPLSLTLRLVFDFLARHRHVPLGASQIAASFQAEPFYREHGCNALKSGALIRRVSKSSVRVYIERIRRALALSFREANLQIEPRDVLVSTETVTNEVGYRLRCPVEWVHSDHPGPEFAWVEE